MAIDIKQQIKEVLLEKNLSMTDLVNLLNENKPDKEKTTLQSLNNKLTRGTIKYSEILEIAQVMKYNILWQDADQNQIATTKLKTFHKFDESNLLPMFGKAFYNTNIDFKYGSKTGFKNENIVTNQESLKIAKKWGDQNFYDLVAVDLDDTEKLLENFRLDLERNFEDSIDKLLDTIINNYDITIQEHYKELIETYNTNKKFPLSFKLTSLYRVIYRLLSVQSDSSLRDFITNLRNIYMNGDLIQLTDEELKELYDKSLYYLNIFDNKNKD